MDILSQIDGLVRQGEILLVLGRPGSGCSTLLKALAGNTGGFDVAPESRVNYQGVAAHEMHDQLRGKAVYQAEVDVHFPTLLLGDTLDFAANMRAAEASSGEETRAKTVATAEDLGLRNVLGTKVGDMLIPGLSGGERKRASIAVCNFASHRTHTRLQPSDCFC